MKTIPREWKEIAGIYTALGDEHRQRIVLLFEPGESLNVGQIAEVSTLSRSAVSHHLKILRNAGVLMNKKTGTEVYFWLNKAFLIESMEKVILYLKSNG